MTTNSSPDSHVEVGDGAAGRTRRRLGRAPTFSLLIVILGVGGALFSGAIVGNLVPEPSALDLADALAPPWPAETSSLAHPLGTDRFGRDVLSRMLVGARLSLSIAAITIVAAGALGTLAGLIVGYRGGWLDAVSMRIADILLSFPSILIAIIFSVTLGPNYWIVVVVLTVYLLPQFMRLVRGEVLTWKQREFVVVARIVGSHPLTIVARHILPNLLDRVVVLASLQVGWVIVAEAGLSFIGAGVPPPSPTWGNMLSDGRELMSSAWWLTVFPGVAITLIVLSFNRLGDWLRDELDPHIGYGM